MNHKFGIALAGLTLGAAAFAQTKWDLPTAYPATNYHTENITQFAKDVDAATGGKVKITMNGSQEVTAVAIDPAVVNPDEAELLEDLVLFVTFACFEERPADACWCAQGGQDPGISRWACAWKRARTCPSWP